MKQTPLNLEDRLKDGIETASAEETEALAHAFAALVPENQVLAFHGDLGVGKTTFIRGMARAWGIREAVTSPSFNLFTIYSGTRQLVHLDAYRLHSASDLDALMIEDFLVEPWCLAVEWPDRVASWLPAECLHLHLNIAQGKTHRIRLSDTA